MKSNLLDRADWYIGWVYHYKVYDGSPLSSKIKWVMEQWKDNGEFAQEKLSRKFKILEITSLESVSSSQENIGRRTFNIHQHVQNVIEQVKYTWSQVKEKENKKRI